MRCERWSNVCLKRLDNEWLMLEWSWGQKFNLKKIKFWIYFCLEIWNKHVKTATFLSQSLLGEKRVKFSIVSLSRFLKREKVSCTSSMIFQENLKSRLCTNIKSCTPKKSRINQRKHLANQKRIKNYSKQFSELLFTYRVILQTIMISH